MSTTPVLPVHSELAEKKAKLDAIRAALKTEFFGIDRCIDAVMDSIQTWWLFPSIIMRPPIVALWGMTGVGKTALVRSLVSHLGMTNRFLEIQMDGFSGSTTTEEKTISGLLNQSGIEEGQQGIVLLDEFQRFRTINDKGEDIRLERYPDVWMLLSDGRFPMDHSKLERLVEYMNCKDYYEDFWEQDRAEKEAKGIVPEETPYKTEVKRSRRFLMTHDEAESIKQNLRRPETLREIMTWSQDKCRKLIEGFLAANDNRPFDYTRCLVFMSGNLDEAYRMAGNVEDCDTSADVFYQHTLKIGPPEIKGALTSRFRPEQIARLGNNHVVYPSLQESAYKSLIRRSCLEYVEQSKQVCGIQFMVEESVYQEIYDNSVYPTQGTRPVFTSIHKLFGSPLSDAILWGMEHKLSAVNISLDIPALSLLFKSGELEKRVKIDFEIRARRKSRTADFNALVAVHEAGHALVYAALFKRAPVEVSANVASFKGGYNLYQDVFLCKDEVLSRVAVCMAGIVAEETVFGQELRSTGCESDVAKATANAGNYVRRYAMDGFQGTVQNEMSQLFLVDIERTDKAIETIVGDQKERAQTVLTQHRQLLLDLSNQLLKTPKMDGAAFVAFVGSRIPGLVVADERDVNSDYAARLAKAGA